MQITIDSICKEFDIRPEEIFAFMDEEHINLGGDLMHDISIDVTDFRKFIEYWRRQLQMRIDKAERDLSQLDGRVDSFLRNQKSQRIDEWA